MVARDDSLLILDLDETLDYASETELGRPADFVMPQYFVYHRPGLQSFLRARALQFQLAIWSSGTEDYVQAILEKILPNELELSFVWSRERCGLRRNLETDEMYYQKDLKKVTKLGYQLERMLIMEDKKESVRRHFGNAVYVKPFYGDESDEELEKLGPFLDYLSTVDNVRNVEKRNWAGWKKAE